MNRNHLYNELIQRHKTLIKRVVSQYFPNQMDADDVFQEIGIHIFQKLEVISNDEIKKWNSAAWLTTISKNKCKDILKSTKKVRKHFSPSDSEELLNKYSLESEEGIRVEWKTSLKNILIELKSDERKIIILRFIKGYSAKDVGDLMGLSNPSLYIKRILKKLKKKINGDLFFELFDGWILDDIHSFLED